MKGFAALAMAACILNAGGVACAAKEKPPLIAELERVTGLELTLAQREKIAACSRGYAEELREMHAAFLAEVSKAVGLSQKVLKEKVFAGMSPSFKIGEAQREAIERLSDGYLSYRQKRSLKEVEARWQKERERAGEAYAQAVASLTDVPADEILGFINTHE